MVCTYKSSLYSLCIYFHMVIYGIRRPLALISRRPVEIEKYFVCRMCEKTLHTHTHIAKLEGYCE